MNVRTRTPLTTRCVAAVVLVFWVMASVNCWRCCARRGCAPPSVSADKVHSSCEAHCAKKRQSQKSQLPCPDSDCFAKKSLATETDAADRPAPSLPLAYLTEPFLVLFSSADTASASSTRPSTSRDWVFTPEVSLGPAFRSLAPPVFL